MMGLQTTSLEVPDAAQTVTYHRLVRLLARRRPCRHHGQLILLLGCREGVEEVRVLVVTVVVVGGRRARRRLNSQGQILAVCSHI